MNLKQLETFAWTVRLGSFSAAARRLNSSQPAVSMRIRDLERSLSVELFERPRRATRLTPKGRELMEYADRILNLASEAEARLGDPKAVSGRIRVGVGETIAVTWLPRFIARLNETFPGLVIELDVDLTASLWNKFEAGDLEVLLLPGPALGANLVVDDLGSARYAWVASPTLGIPTGRTLRPRDLAPWPIITLSRDSVLHEIIEDWFGGSRAEFHRNDVCNSLGVVVSLTISGLGISLLPPAVYAREIERGELMVIDAEPRLDPIEFISAFRRDREPALMQAIADLASEASTFRAPVAGQAAGGA
jgi:DNA-binding transcriptional LysR family regulator